MESDILGRWKPKEVLVRGDVRNECSRPGEIIKAQGRERGIVGDAVTRADTGAQKEQDWSPMALLIKQS